jgi:hypothetical protein
MHSPGKGISKRSIPYKRSPPSWLKSTAAEVEDKICKLAKKGLKPSQVTKHPPFPSFLIFVVLVCVGVECRI